MVLSIVLLSHNQVVTLEQQMDGRRHFILFIQLGFALMFAALYGLAIYHRKSRPTHSRYMVLTGILMHVKIVILPPLQSNNCREIVVPVVMS